MSGPRDMVRDATDGGGLRVGLAVPAAGTGQRMGGQRKPWLRLAGEPLLVHALRPFLADARVCAVRVALSASDLADPPPWLAALDRRVGLVAGGEDRVDSVAHAVEALPGDLDIILVHDAARPLVTSAVVDRVIESVAAGCAAIAAWPAVDTLKVVDPRGHVVETPDRSRFWHAQTPQGFPAGLLRAVLARPDLRTGVTDDASLVELAGGNVVVVRGSPRNLKVTCPADLELAEVLLRQGEETP